MAVRGPANHEAASRRHICALKTAGTAYVPDVSQRGADRPVLIRDTFESEHSSAAATCSTDLVLAGKQLDLPWPRSAPHGRGRGVRMLSNRGEPGDPSGIGGADDGLPVESQNP
jgi:hypothetical protein